MVETCFTGVVLENYKLKWRILNWASVQLDKELVEKQMVHIDTGKSSNVRSTWIVGLKISTDDNRKVIRVYWKLWELQDGIEEIAVKTSTTFLYGDGSEHSTYEKHQTLKRLGQIEVPKVMSYKLSELNWIPGAEKSWVDKHDCRNITLQLTVKVKLPGNNFSSKVSRIKLENYRKLSQKKFGDKFAATLDDLSSTDIKIVTSDDKHLLAHRLILKAQCPVFDSMFQSKLTEDKTGIVNVEDICEKTMKIILHYFYTGQLLPNWNDRDIIVEFIYAAGKYQMTEVLDMINNGLLEEVEDFDCKMGCGIELLSMLQKLSLENAESWLMKKIVKATNQAKNSSELLALFAEEKYYNILDLIQLAVKLETMLWHNTNVLYEDLQHK